LVVVALVVVVVMMMLLVLDAPVVPVAPAGQAGDAVAMAVELVIVVLLQPFEVRVGGNAAALTPE